MSEEMKGPQPVDQTDQGRAELSQNSEANSPPLPSEWQADLSSTIFRIAEQVLSRDDADAYAAVVEIETYMAGRGLYYDCVAIWRQLGCQPPGEGWELDPHSSKDEDRVNYRRLRRVMKHDA